MILAIEIVFLIAGLYAAFTARMPGWMVGKGYKAEGAQVRILGVCMAALLPGMLCSGFGIGLIGGLMGSDPTGFAVLFEIVSVILAAIIFTVVLRRIRQPDLPPPAADFPPSQSGS